MSVAGQQEQGESRHVYVHIKQCIDFARKWVQRTGKELGTRKMPADMTRLASQPLAAFERA
eukprot:886824-Pleurochrysis_carterae.AAC.2